MNTKKLIPRSTVIFAALTVAGITVAASAQLVPDSFSQTLMVAIGSAIFGAGLTFFLVYIANLTEK